MKGFRFYLEFENKSAKKKSGKENRNHSGNVVAIFNNSLCVRNGSLLYEGLSGVYFEENSPVNYGSIGYEYLHDNCKRISEKLAREIHPELFKRLDD